LPKHFFLTALVYFAVLPFIYLLSALPFRALYLFSDFVFFVLYYLVGYRKKVVLDNLRRSFPEKSEDEINKICRKFYRYLCDITLETFKVLTISRKSMIEHCKFNPEGFALLNRLAEEHKNVILVMGHFGNWEWAGHPFSLLCKHKLFVIYHPLSNKYFNSLMLKMRSRFGTEMIEMKNTYKEMLANKGILNTTAFIADQTPQPNNAFWTNFLNQNTPVFKGTEVIAKKMNLPVVYASIRKVRRGYYEMYVELLTENPANTADGEITEMHTRKLEEDIRSMPEAWLWSHKRWKHCNASC